MLETLFNFDDSKYCFLEYSDYLIELNNYIYVKNIK